MGDYRVRIMKEYSLLIHVAVILSALHLVQPSWWYLGMAGSTQPIASELDHIGMHGRLGRPKGRPRPGDGPFVSCSDVDYLEPRQRELCSLDKSLLNVISLGAYMGIKECQTQFKERRWNCSTFNTTSVFGNVLNINTRETAYVYAISSAAVTYAVTKACSRGELAMCGCNRRWKKYKKKETFSWGGCSDNIRFGARFAKKFVDSNEQDLNAESLMNIWNNGAGRKTTKKSMVLKCKCHGATGSCGIKVCWEQLKPFRSIGTKLKKKFDEASMVRFDNKRRRLKRAENFQMRPKKDELVYLNRSPNFCEYDPVKGSMGTRGRQCNKTSDGLDGCLLMCCGRGYYTLIKEQKVDCDCKFHWCCYVECKQCIHKHEVHYCN